MARGIQPRHAGGVIGVGIRAGGEPLHRAGIRPGIHTLAFVLLQIAADVPAVTRRGGQGGAQLFQHMGRPVIVAVQKQQPLALGGLDAGIARGGQPAVRAVDDHNAGAKLSKSITHGGAGIRGAIVHQDALPVRRAGLLHHAFDAGRKISLHIIHRHNDRKCDVSCAFHRSCFLYFVGINVQSWSYRRSFCRWRTSGPARSHSGPAHRPATAPTS